MCRYRIDIVKGSRTARRLEDNDTGTLDISPEDYKSYIGVRQGFGVMEKKMETTIMGLYRAYILR